MQSHQGRFGTVSLRGTTTGRCGAALTWTLYAKMRHAWALLLYGKRHKIRTWRPQTANQQQKGTPAEIILRPCSNLLESALDPPLPRSHLKLPLTIGVLRSPAKLLRLANECSSAGVGTFNWAPQSTPRVGQDSEGVPINPGLVPKGSLLYDGHTSEPSI